MSLVRPNDQEGMAEEEGEKTRQREVTQDPRMTNSFVLFGRFSKNESV